MVKEVSLAPIATPDASQEISLQQLRECAQCHRENTRKSAGPDESDTNAVSQFHEIELARGQLGRFPGSEVLPILKQMVWT